MGKLNDPGTLLVDGTNYPLAEYLNELFAGVLLAQQINTETITATKALDDGDYQIQLLTPSGANRDVELPVEASTNHVHVIKNPSGATYDLVVKDDSGTTTYCTLDAGEWALCWSDGTAWSVIYSGDLASATTKTPTTGWVEVTDTWTYASASTITVPSDATTTYQKWMRVRFKQGGSYKYFVVQSLTSTVLTVVTNTDYTVANAAITDIAYSFMDKPYGFPDEFNFSPSWTNLTVGSGTLTAKLKVSAQGLVQGHVELVFSGTAVSGSVTIATPVPTGTYGGSSAFPVGRARYIDTGTGSSMGAILLSGSTIYIYAEGASTTYVVSTPLSSTVPHTWADTDVLMFNFEYFG